MARQLILDTNALIAYERATFDTTTLDSTSMIWPSQRSRWPSSASASN